VRPKTAYEIIRDRDGLSVSYESFKRFARERALGRKERKLMIRIEMPPGIETQIDYGKAGLHHDRATGRNRVVNAFCGILSHSRLPFVQFVYTQKQQSFVGSIVDMFEYYGGTNDDAVHGQPQVGSYQTRSLGPEAEQKLRGDGRALQCVHRSLPGRYAYRQGQD